MRDVHWHRSPPLPSPWAANHTPRRRRAKRDIDLSPPIRCRGASSAGRLFLAAMSLILAVWGPARHAARVPPEVAIRTE